MKTKKLDQSYIENQLKITSDSINKLTPQEVAQNPSHYFYMKGHRDCLFHLLEVLKGSKL